MDDIARLAGVSKSTVSRALADSPLVNDRTKARIRELAQQHQYTIDQRARNFRLQQTNTIAVAFPVRHNREQHISDPFFLDLLGHLADGLTERGYAMLLTKPKMGDDNWLDDLVSAHRADGLILMGQGIEHDRINKLAKSYVPLVVWGAEIPDQLYTNVGGDNLSGGYEATKHLIDQGRRRIVYLGSVQPPEIRERYQGYLKAHESAGLSVDPELHIPVQLSNELAYEAMRAYLDAGLKLDAVIAASDVIAMSAIRALKEFGHRVPEEVAVVGYDDIPLAPYVDPPLTTIKQDTLKAATLLLDSLFKKIGGEDFPSATIPAELIIRSSSVASTKN